MASTGMSAPAKNVWRQRSRSSFALRFTISAETTGLLGSGIGKELSPSAHLQFPPVVQRPGPGQSLARGVAARAGAALRDPLVRQNLVLFFGGLIAGVGGFVYHAIAGRILGPEVYGQVAFLIAVYAVGTGPALIIITVLARYTAMLAARGDPGVRSLTARTVRLVAIPCLAFILLTALFGRAIAVYAHVGSTIPILVLGFSIALIWQVAIPRGILQGLQRFTSLSLNLSLELVIRTSVVFVLLKAGYAVSGAMAAVFAGLAIVFVLGLYSLRDHFRGTGSRVRLRVMAGFSLTAAAGIIGVQILYNQDVILAEHYLNSHDGGIYGGLNKIGTILFFLTLSVLPVLFPRVVEAVAKDEHPGRLLLWSAGILTALGVGAVLVCAAVPWLVLGVLFGPSFRDAIPLVFPVGVIGLALSLDNLLVQFFMAVHDRVFVPILAFGVVVEGRLIFLFHARWWHEV